MATVCHECRDLSGGSVRNRRTSRLELSEFSNFPNYELDTSSRNFILFAKLEAFHFLTRIPQFMSGKCHLSFFPNL